MAFEKKLLVLKDRLLAGDVSPDSLGGVLEVLQSVQKSIGQRPDTTLVAAFSGTTCMKIYPTEVLYDLVCKERYDPPVDFSKRSLNRLSRLTLVLHENEQLEVVGIPIHRQLLPPDVVNMDVMDIMTKFPCQLPAGSEAAMEFQYARAAYWSAFEKLEPVDFESSPRLETFRERGMEPRRSPTGGFPYHGHVDIWDDRQLGPAAFRTESHRLILLLRDVGYFLLLPIQGLWFDWALRSGGVTKGAVIGQLVEELGPEFKSTAPGMTLPRVQV